MDLPGVSEEAVLAVAKVVDPLAFDGGPDTPNRDRWRTDAQEIARQALEAVAAIPFRMDERRATAVAKIAAHGVGRVIAGIEVHDKGALVRVVLEDGASILLGPGPLAYEAVDAWKDYPLVSGGPPR